MIVVSDASPLNYLILVESAHLLPKLFAQVYVPHKVVIELQHAGAPQPVRDWIANMPEWLLLRTPFQIDANLGLDPGEAHAISLATELRADHVLIDEWAARRVATGRGLHVVGTLGLLDQAAERNLIMLPDVLDRLLRTSFRIDRKLVSQIIDRDRRRRHE